MTHAPAAAAAPVVVDSVAAEVADMGEGDDAGMKEFLAGLE